MAFDEDDIKRMLGDDDQGDDHEDTNREKCLLGKLAIPSFMLEIIKAKSETLSESLGICADLYKALDSGSPSPDLNSSKETKEKRKDEVFKYMKDLWSETKNSVSQYDYLIALLEDPESEGK
jgi:hypothetical protein